MTEETHHEPTLDSAAASHGLADDLHRLQKAANGVPISIARVLETLEDRGLAVVILVLSAPFVVIPIPGVSTIFGFILLALSIGILFDAKPWLPKFICRHEVQPKTVDRLVRGTDRVLIKFLRFSKPRMEWAAVGVWHRMAGIALVLATIAFALPLPIPGNNIPPAIALVMISLGLLERDGLLLIAGYAFTLLMWVIIITVSIIFWEAVDGYVHRLWTKAADVFDGPN